jgi:DNA-binding LacI/PurR family transcriptional regulator
VPRQRIISQDVAKRAGVSRTTVSFVLNGVKEANISEETRERVLAAAAELGYVPDATAQALATGRSRTIGLVFTRSNPYANVGSTHIQIIEGLMGVVRQFGVRLLIDSLGHAETADSYLDLARTKRIDGLILFDLRADDQALYDLVHDDFPVVLLGRLPGVNVCSVEFDNRAGAQAAVEHLLAQGHTRIGLIAHGPLAFTGVTERALGYQDALATAGIAFDDTLVRYGDFGPDSGFAAAMSLLAAPVAPTALFVTSDVVAYGVLAALHERGIAIPDAMAVVGFDDQPLARFLTPPLTTVRISFEDMGRQAGKLLLDLIHRDIEPGRQVLLDAALIVRASSIAGYRP